MFNTKGNATVNNCFVDEKTTIRNAEITSGLIGDFLSSESNLTVNNSTVNCVIIGSESIEAISAAGAVGRIGISSINDIKINGVNVFASITGSECVGGLIGLVKDGTEFNSSSPLASKCVVAPMIVQSGNNADNNTGLIIGSVSHSKAINKNNINSAIADIIISTYFGDVSAFGKSTNLSSSKYKDMDKPYGKNIEPSVKVINSRDNVKVSIKNLPEFNGYKFDIKTGWISESNDRIEIIESSENYVVLKAKHLADISIIGYYIFESNNQIRIPVHFNILSAVRTALKGTGTLSDPYLVANAYDLETVSQYDSDGMVFALSKDIAFVDSDYVFGGAFYNVGNGIVTIGSAESGFKGTFTGKYNGTIHTIKGLKLSGNAFGGLFGAIDSAKISDLIIDSAEVSGENYSGILAGKAVNSEISNVTIKSSKVNVTEIGGFAGGLIGYADKVNLKNINIDSTAVSTLIDGTSFTTEYAGGIVGSFSGNAVNCTLNNVSVKSTTVAGGVFGESKDAVIVKNCKFNTNISAVVCGGVIGEISNPIETAFTDISISGSANGTEISGGVFGRISGNESVEKKDSPLVKNILVANKISNCSKCGIVVGDVSEKIFTNFENTECNVFENIYYSSYQNNFGISGNENVNSYQSDEYKVSDINNVKYVSGNEKYDSVLFNSDTVTINEQNISIENIDGNYKSFKVAGITSNLINVTSNIENLITYDDSNSTVKLNKISVSSAKIEFVYDSGVVLSLGISQENALSGMGTQNSPYIINNVNDFALMIKTNESGLHYILNNDINLEGLSFTSDYKAELNGNGKVIYNYSGDSLFNTITGSISNLGLMGFKIDSGASESVGALASEIDGGKIYNCFVIADVFADGKVQDAGILAGRMINGANATYVITSGRVISDKAISLGGVAGTIINSEIIKSTSTAYVKGTKNVGGICGTAEFAELSNVIFANMVESTSSVYGNICGEADENTKVNNAYFDSTAAKSQKAFGIGSFNAEALTTDELTTTKIDGFKFTDGYSIPADINRKSFDELFKTGYSFATMVISYLSGFNSGTALNYTSVKVDEKVRNSNVKVDNTNGLIITLLNQNCANKIQRFANPITQSATQISYTVVDSTKNKTFSDKLLGVMFKTKTDNSSNGLNIFTKANDGAEKLEGIYINDGEMFVDLALPNNYKFDVTAYNESGKELSVSDYSSEGYSVKTNNSQQVNIIVTIKDNSIPWGLHSVWSVIGK
ncbi:MAG: hypothetical protein KBT46_01210 [Ruminococcus sp.]|nr:hypothetical protein [Candidatus Copronaster equi]